MKPRFLPAAREELEAAALYLDERAPGLGPDLISDVERIGELICEFPQIGRTLDRMHRSIPLQRFSFSLAYRISAGEIIIVAVAHNRRRPGYWRVRK
jgi:toxin ParE1/3/4